MSQNNSLYKLDFIEPDTNLEVREILYNYQVNQQNQSASKYDYQHNETSKINEEIENISSNLHQNNMNLVESSKKQQFIISTTLDEDEEKARLIHELESEVNYYEKKYRELESGFETNKNEIQEEVKLREYERKIKDMQREIEIMMIQEVEKERELAEYNNEKFKIISKIIIIVKYKK